MLKTLGAQIKEYKWASIATPVFMLLEVAVDTIIPLLMASIIDNGVNMGDTRHIYIMGVWMIVAALFGLLTGCLGAKYGAKAAMGFGKICVLQCFATSRPFPLQISTDSHPLALSHV